MIYFLLAKELDAVKIGHTSRDPVTRAREIQASCPCELTLLRVAEGDEYAEARIHAAAADHWLRGEWFRYSTLQAFCGEIDPAAFRTLCPACDAEGGIVPQLSNYRRAQELAKGSRAAMLCPSCRAKEAERAA